MAVRIGLVGTGTVGCGCLDLLAKNGDDYRRLLGIDVELVRVCSRRPVQAAERGLEAIYTDRWREVAEADDVDIVVELVGGTGVAAEVVLAALAAGKIVVTANKALMSTRGQEVMEAAAAHGAEVLFEASVGGGIPVIGPLKHSLLANEVQSVMGIVNGTTNYMLTRMAADGAAYADVLADAQAAGFAEADPSADVDGLDAAAKTAILASIAFNSRVTLDDVYTEGITNIAPEDLDAARDMGYAVKLLAIAHRCEDGIDVRVHPTMIPLNHQLATVGGVMNAVYVEGDAVGQVMFTGPGAGAAPTASAVMGDVLEAARRIQAKAPVLVGCTCAQELPIVPMTDLATKYYIRFVVDDRPGVLAAMAQVFADYDVSVRSVIQRGQKSGGVVTLAYVTHTAKESSIRAALARIAQLENVLHAEPSVIRVED